MNRVIKFRVWDIEIHMWINNLGMGKDNTLTKGTEKRFHVMQFTGLHDKNDKEIYEGDIIDDGLDKPVLVWWNVKFASFCLRKDGWAFSHFFGDSCDPKNCEVIGNIHENPELINQ
jgi:hypothetical protein